MRSATALGLAMVVACLLGTGCPSPWAKYAYEKLPATAVHLRPGGFLSGGGEPIAVTIQADDEWQDTRLDLAAGEAVHVAAEGSWNPDVSAGERDCGPRGYRNPTGYYVPEVRSLPYAALIGRIGNGRPFLVGAATIVAATADGRLRMTCNRSLNSTILGRGTLEVRLVPGRSKASLLQDGR